MILKDGPTCSPVLLIDLQWYIKAVGRESSAWSQLISTGPGSKVDRSDVKLMRSVFVLRYQVTVKASSLAMCPTEVERNSCPIQVNLQLLKIYPTLKCSNHYLQLISVEQCDLYSAHH